MSLLNLNSTALYAARRYSLQHHGLMGPAVKLIIHQYQLDPEKINGTGPKKNLLKSDVLSFIDKQQLKPAAIKSKAPQVSSSNQQAAEKPKPKKGEKFVDIPLSNMRKTIAKRLTQSKQTIPHSYISVDLSAEKLTSIRKTFAKDGTKVSVNDFLIKAAGLALEAVPEVNVQWKNEQISQISSIDISVAVATPNGLITPIVFNANRLQVEQISKTVRELASRAKENKLQLNEFQGGSFTISNLGMFGSVNDFTAIINPPQTAILAVGGTRLELNDNLVPENRFTVTLCYDARAIDEIHAQRFVNHLQLLIGEPETIIAGSKSFNLENVNFAALL